MPTRRSPSYIDFAVRTRARSAWLRPEPASARAREHFCPSKTVGATVPTACGELPTFTTRNRAQIWLYEVSSAATGLYAPEDKCHYRARPVSWKGEDMTQRRRKVACSTHAHLIFGLLAAAAACSPTNTPSAVSPEPPQTSQDATPPLVADPQGQGEQREVARKSDRPTTIDDWWPNRLDLRVLRAHAPKGDPSDDTFDYAAEFSKLDLAAVKKDIAATLTTSQDWWPADWGHYGGLMIRLAWHSAGTYRTVDGRGGAASGIIRFAPLNSWPDNVSLDKARRLLWPIKQKYGRSISWADLIILTGNVALESMGFKTFGFGGGRQDIYEPTDINWGPETEWLADQRFSADGKELERPLGATQMGLIYVNPEGPNGNPDPLAAAHHIRTTFGRMAMNDEETVALIAGGHSFGKAHGAHKAADCVGREPEGAPLEEQGLGWKNKCGTGHGADTVTSGLEGAWTQTPTQWSHLFFKNLFEHEWELTKSPAGAHQWTPKGGTPRKVPDAHDPTKRHNPIMLTTDISLRVDPKYSVISRRFYEHPEEFELAFAKAWFKLTHRDMGPHVRLLGSEVPEAQVWQDPVPVADYAIISDADVTALKRKLLNSGLTPAQLVKTAWAAASSFRDTDLRGGANGGRLRLSPQKDWAVNEPAELAKVLPVYTQLSEEFNKGGGRKKVSVADLIVLGGVAAIEDAAKKAGVNLKVPFSPGRTDALPEQTDVESFSVLEPKLDGFRNYVGQADSQTAARALIERADFLNLTAAEMSVLVAGLRVLDANHGGQKHGVFTQTPGVLTNDFFVNLLDNHLVWEKVDGTQALYEAKDRKTGQRRWTGTSVDLVFGSHSQLRAIAEVYAAGDAKEKFVRDFVNAWTKVMNLDRFDLEKRPKPKAAAKVVAK
jgi:catalase-peroxidase